MSDPARDELMAHELALIAMGEMLHTLAAAGLPDLAESLLDGYPEYVRELVGAALAASDPRLAEHEPAGETHRGRGHLRLVPPIW